MYENGDYVICRSGGVWRVTETGGDKIRIERHESGAVNILPETDGEIVRKISSKETILDAIERIPFIRSLQAPNDKTRRKLYDQSMSKHDEIEWIKVIKTIYLRQNIMSNLKPSELSYGEKAKGYLHGEISVLLEMPLDEVESYIASTFSKNSNN